MNTLHEHQIVITEFRRERQNSDVILETVGRVTHADDEVVIFKVLRQFCYVDGYREMGRRLPVFDDSFEAQLPNLVRPTVTN